MLSLQCNLRELHVHVESGSRVAPGSADTLCFGRSVLLAGGPRSQVTVH